MGAGETSIQEALNPVQRSHYEPIILHPGLHV
jgi:hypothetical protein